MANIQDIVAQASSRIPQTTSTHGGEDDIIKQGPRVNIEMSTWPTRSCKEYSCPTQGRTTWVNMGNMLWRMLCQGKPNMTSDDKQQPLEHCTVSTHTKNIGEVSVSQYSKHKV